jgi:hypothetical protein
MTMLSFRVTGDEAADAQERVSFWETADVECLGEAEPLSHESGKLALEFAVFNPLKAEEQLLIEY